MTIYSDIRIDHAKRISELDLDGYAVGGLAVGETHEEMYHILDETVPYLPLHKPTYLMGVGTMINCNSSRVIFYHLTQPSILSKISP